MRGFIHKPVMLREVLDCLSVRSGGGWVDGTCGGGGHSEAILEASIPDGFLWACDRDGDAIEAATERLGRHEGRWELKRMNFSALDQWLGRGRADGVLLDLGVSSYQLDEASRGFSFQADGPLDMRMDVRGGMTAAELVNGWGVGEMARIFRELGGEPEAGRMARAIEAERRVRPFTGTGQLAACIERVSPRRGRRAHPATRCFQAIRMVVNGELEALEAGLEAAWRVLKRGGRLVVITFHSGEDRMVREFMRTEAREYDMPPGQPDVPELRIPRAARARLVSRKAIQPSEEEQLENPRARSAQVRVAEKLED
jgi:16S rRNA (cytosine1402-N4)-methyltransferase